MKEEIKENQESMTPEEKELIALQYKLELMTDDEIFNYAVENYPEMPPFGKKKLLVRRIINTARQEIIDKNNKEKSE